METWKAIPGYAGLYEVSTLGNVRRPDGALLKTRLNTYGYPRINLSKDGQRRSYAVHGLVLAAFVGPRPEGQECRHLDGNRANAALENLVWGTSTENKADMARHGTVLKGETHPCAKLTAEKIQQIRDFDGSVRQTARAFGINPSHAWKIRQKGVWQHVT